MKDIWTWTLQVILDVLIQASKTFIIKRDFATAKVPADLFQQYHPDQGAGGASFVGCECKLWKPPCQVCWLSDCPRILPSQCWSGGSTSYEDLTVVSIVKPGACQRGSLWNCLADQGQLLWKEQLASEEFGKGCKDFNWKKSKIWKKQNMIWIVLRLPLHMSSLHMPHMWMSIAQVNNWG